MSNRLCIIHISDYTPIIQTHALAARSHQGTRLCEYARPARVCIVRGQDSVRGLGTRVLMARDLAVTVGVGLVSAIQ